MENLIEIISERPVLVARYTCYICFAAIGIIAAIVKKRMNK